MGKLVFLFFIFISPTAFCFVHVGKFQTNRLAVVVRDGIKSELVENKAASEDVPTNIKLENVLNVRDFASAYPNMKRGKVFRAGCVSNASAADVTVIIFQTFPTLKN